IEVYYGGLMSLTINRYRQVVDDLIQTLQVDSIIVTRVSTGVDVVLPTLQYQNVGKTLSAGWDGTGSLNLGPLSFKGTYSWNDTRVIYSNSVFRYAGY